MPTVNMRQLRQTRQLKAWLRAGKKVSLRDRNQVIAEIVPAKASLPHTELPDFAALRRKIFGGRTFPGTELLLEDRERS